MEKGAVRRKDIVDILPEHNEGVPLIPQIIASDADEFDKLCDIIQETGYHQIDLNMGCPAPMQTKLSRGSAMLSSPELVEEIANRMKTRSDLRFSVKMRLGWKEPDEWRQILPILHDIPLEHITLHPRIGIQQYKGEVNMEMFKMFYEACQHPLIYNGDIQTLDDLARMEEEFPRLTGIMMGRGLLANPVLSAEYASGTAWTWAKRRDTVLRMHDEWLQFCREKYVSDSQVLLQVKPFWEYQNAWIGKKVYKHLMKSGSFRNYMAAVHEFSALKEEE
jgi:tRNA-dihydrouridine synthase